MALGGTGALLYTRKPAEAGKERAAEAQKAKAAPSFVAFEPLIVNLRDEEAERMMQIAFSFESADSKAAEAVKVHTPAIRNRLILLLTSKSSRDIAGREGKERLAAEILAEARAAMGATKEAPLVEAVHFTSIIVQ
jgi:flagellar FliL protein